MQDEFRSPHPWTQSTRFEALDQRETLFKVIENIEKKSGARDLGGGLPATVVYDLDSTLFEVRSRTQRIIKEFLRSGAIRSPHLARWAMEIRPQTLAYTIEESALLAGVDLADAEVRADIEALRTYWRARFFSSAYLTHDLPTLGARDFVWRTLTSGAKIIYLTGRDRPGMELGTVAQLRHWGFPIDNSRTDLVMKPYFGQDDTEFKDRYLGSMAKDHSVAAIFDNEPAHFSAFERSVPDAMLVFRHSTCSPKDAAPVKKVFKISDFQT